MLAMGGSVWPNDVVREPGKLERDHPEHLVCFLLSPFEPPALFDEVYAAVRTVCERCAHDAGVPIECLRADSLSDANWCARRVGSGSR